MEIFGMIPFFADPALSPIGMAAGLVGPIPSVQQKVVSLILTDDQLVRRKFWMMVNGNATWNGMTEGFSGYQTMFVLKNSFVRAGCVKRNDNSSVPSKFLSSLITMVVPDKSAWGSSNVPKFVIALSSKIRLLSTSTLTKASRDFAHFRFGLSHSALLHFGHCRTSDCLGIQKWLQRLQLRFGESFIFILNIV
jgi:hypothetical protein